jgi:hypothetical protein
MEPTMSTIDKDKKTKLSAPSDKKFILGFKDGFANDKNGMSFVVALKILGVRK